MLTSHFDTFRKKVIGINEYIDTPYARQLPLVYADWTASGRMYADIEQRLQDHFYPMVANTHTDTNDTGMTMTYAYHKAKQIIKAHIGASDNDVLISCGSGMTGAVCKLQRILGLKAHERHMDCLATTEEERPVVFVSHMEHHSNQTSWIETLADVVVVPPCSRGLVCPDKWKETIAAYAHRTTRIAAITSCSNVTGIITPYMDVAQVMHEVGGLCFVDFACSAPYIDIVMHEDDASGRYIDALYFSPHKFLGGPGTTGILAFCKELYTNEVPDHPGGGTVDWTNPWGEHKFVDNIEDREDGGTPPFLQTIRVAMCCELKDQMGVDNIHAREAELLEIIWSDLEGVDNLHILADQHKDRLGVISFYIDGLHYNLAVKMLNDRYGIQTRGGCSCAGTYGHYLLNVDQEWSQAITKEISSGNCSNKPGWVRFSIHPTHTDEEVRYICEGIKEVANNYRTMLEDYDFNPVTGSIRHKRDQARVMREQKVDNWLFFSKKEVVV
jgi:selenocysteine lyase/cysteine desulfurase